ncbi:MAG: hypothetical protein ACTHOG_07360 [Marmoricola sp.]
MASLLLAQGWRDVWYLVAAVGVLLIASAIITPMLVRRGLRTPAGLRIINQLSDRIVDVVKRPITVMVLDEVIDVIRTGQYTRNISDAIIENEDHLKALVAEKIRQDGGIGVIAHLPGYDKVVSQISESVLHVLIAMLGDPRMDEFVADLLRNNLEQIQEAVHRREYENVAAFRRPGE